MIRAHPHVMVRFWTSCLINKTAIMSTQIHLNPDLLAAGKSLFRKSSGSIRSSRNVFIRPFVHLLFFLIVILSPRVSFGTATGGYTFSNCAAGANYIEFQVNLTNTSTAGEVLYLNASSPIRINHAAGIVPAGTNTFIFQYIAGSADASVAPLYATIGTTYNVAYTASSRLMQVTHSSTVLGNSAAAVNCPIQPGSTVSVGKFRLTITNTNFIAGQSVGLTWVTTSGFTAFVNTSTTTTAFNATNGNRTLGTPCSMSIPSACSVSATSSSTNVTCQGGSDGTASVSATGSSPFTYLWSSGESTSSITGLSAGTYTVTVTGTGGCTTTATATVSDGTATSTNTTTTSACDSYTWSVDGNTYTQSGSYTSVSGCATEILALTIIPSSTNNTTAAACDSYIWSVNGTTYTQSGSYSNVSGCQTEIITLTIDKPIFTSHPSTMSQKSTQGITLPAYAVAVSGGSGFTFQWYSNTINSNSGGSIIPSAQSTTYFPPTQTTGIHYYYCKATTSNGCEVVSNPSGPVQVCGN